MSAINTEIGVVGSALNDPASFIYVIQSISNHDVFQDPQAKLVFGAMYDAYIQTGVVDISSVRMLLQRRGQWGDLEDFFVSAISENLPIQTLEVRIREMVERHELNVLSKMSADLQGEVRAGVLAPADICVKYMDKMSKIISKSSEASIKSLAKVLAELEKEIDAVEAGNGTVGYSTGYELIDRSLLYEPGDLIVMAARPGMGKSAVMLDLAKKLAIVQGIPTAIFSMEMPNKHNGMRIMAAETGLKFSMINRGYFTKENEVNFKTKRQQLSKYPLYLDDDPYIDCYNIKSKIIYAAITLGCKVIFVDYLGLIDESPYMRETKQTKNDAIGYITRSLKNLAQKLGITIVLLHQLSREVEKRTPPRPILSDLRDSGNIEQDAVKVVFLYRPEYYMTPGESMEDGHGRDLRGMLEFIMAKVRNGPRGTVYLGCNDSVSKFWEHPEFNNNKPISSQQKKQK